MSDLGGLWKGDHGVRAGGVPPAEAGSRWRTPPTAERRCLGLQASSWGYPLHVQYLKNAESEYARECVQSTRPQTFTNTTETFLKVYRYTLQFACGLGNLSVKVKCLFFHFLCQLLYKHACCVWNRAAQFQLNLSAAVYCFMSWWNSALKVQHLTVEQKHRVPLIYCLRFVFYLCVYSSVMIFDTVMWSIFNVSLSVCLWAFN